MDIGLILNAGRGELLLNYYSQSCPTAEDIVKQQVRKLYDKHGNTAVSWIRNLFHDCIVNVTVRDPLIFRSVDVSDTYSGG